MPPPDRAQFLEEAAAVGIETARAEELYARLYPTPAAREVLTDRPTARFSEQSGLSRTVTVLVWIGVALVIGAHAWWSTEGYQGLGWGLVLALTLLWQLGFLAAAEGALRRGYHLLAAGFAAIVAFYTPLTVYALERLGGVEFSESYSDFYPWISSGWVWMEITAIAVAALLLARYRKPFLMLPLTLFVGFLAMDAGTRAFGGSFDDIDKVSVVVCAVGVLMSLAGIVLDYRGWRRFAFWPHFAGLWLVIWGLPTLSDSNSLGLFVTGIVALLIGIWLARVTHLAVGGGCVWCAVSLQAHGVAFPFVLLVGGIALIVLAIWLARSDSPLHRWLGERGLPAPQRDIAY